MKKIIYVLFLTMIFCTCANRSETENVAATSENVILPILEMNQMRDPSDGLLFFRTDNNEIIRNFTNRNTVFYMLELGEMLEALDKLHEIDLSDIDFSIFTDFIKIRNGTITFNYNAPHVVHGGVADYGHPLFYTTPIENSIGKLGGITQVILKEDITVDDNITIVARNSRYEFSRILEFNQLNLIYGFHDSRGYYRNFGFENNFWFSDGNDWQFIVKLNDKILIDNKLHQDVRYSLIYDELDETPFVTNNLRNIDMNKEYTFRSIREGTDIIVIYYLLGHFFFTPVLYVIPNCNVDKEYIEIGISWNDERLWGGYFIKTYTFNELSEVMPLYIRTDVRGFLVR